MRGQLAGPLARTMSAIALICVMLAAAPGWAGTLKVGVIKYGTVNWELDVVKTHGLDTAEGVTLELLQLAGKNATSVALQAGEADIIVTDWIWVSRQRAEGASYTFVPYSHAVGAVMVPADSPLRSIEDLKGKRLGIAGGPLDKSWLLLRGLASEQHGIDLEREAETVFAAPPLLNEEILAGRLDAVLNFWHFTARLEAAGLRRVMGVDEITRALGVDSPVPLIGFVFDAAWAEANRDRILGLLRASQRAKAILRDSDAEWERLRPLMKAKDEATFQALRAGYRRGIPERWGAGERADAERIFRVLAEQGGDKLVGRSKALQDGTFWPHFTY